VILFLLWASGTGQIGGVGDLTCCHVFLPFSPTFKAFAARLADCHRKFIFIWYKICVPYIYNFKKKFALNLPNVEFWYLALVET
jgi:uncharacterized membrane protein